VKWNAVTEGTLVTLATPAKPTGQDPWRMRRRGALFMAIGICLLLVSSSGADVRRGFDPDSGIRFTLNGATLKATIMRAEAQERVFGKRLDAICTTSWRPGPNRRAVTASALWPEGARSARFVFERDISEAARGCLLEDGGADVAGVDFPASAGPSFVAKGLSPHGQWWRLATWRDRAGAPCYLVRFQRARARTCSAPGVLLSLVLEVPRCPGDKFVAGIAAPRTSGVTVRLVNGRTVSAAVYAPPEGSGVRQRPFLVALSGAPRVRSVTAVDAAGRRVARHSLPRPLRRLRCGSAGAG
jgi:hypothetical protein